MEYLIALLPIIAILFLVVVLEKPAFISGPISLVVTLVVASYYYGMNGAWIGASVVRATLLALDIMLIIAGVFLLVAVLKKSNAFYVLRVLTHRLSSDGRIQIIFLAWFVVAFLEGVAGFGTPPMIIAPILIILGFSPLAAISATLIGDAAACTFGAAGTPILIGIAEGLTPVQISILGQDFLVKVATLTSFFHLLVSSLIPFFILCIVSLIETKRLKYALEAWRLALFSGLLFLLPSFFVNYLLGPEFPSILGSLIGLVLFVFFVKKKIFLPRERWIVEKDAAFLEMKDKETELEYEKALFPYAVAVFLLVVSRLNLDGTGDFLKTIKISLTNIFGTDIGYSLHPFYSPGFFFMIASVLAFYVYRMSDRSAETVVKSALGRLGKIFLALVSMLSIVQILINSGHNLSGHSGALVMISQLFSLSGSVWPVFSPLLGLFGAFMAGSSTVSNLMFASVQVDTALALGMSPILALALQGIGSALGNMFAIHNVIAAGAVAHLRHPEGKVIKYTIFPALILALLIGVLVLIWTSLFALP